MEEDTKGIGEGDKTMRKVILLAIVMVLAFGAAANAFAYDREFVFRGEPDGFRGYKRGTNISAFKDLKYVGFLKADKTKLYEKKNDILHIENAKLEFVRYGFWNGKFWFATAKVKSPQDWQSLKSACIKKFGKGRDIGGYISWYGNITEITLGKYLKTLTGEMPYGEKFTLLSGEFFILSKAIGDYKEKLEPKNRH